MKNLLIFTFLTFSVVFGAAANNGTAVSVKDRATNLTNQMIVELRLNNYQANKVRAINLDKAAKIMAIEEANAGNQALINQECKEVYAERDSELERVLSTVQYNNYYGSRKTLNKLDKEFMAKATQQNQGSQGAISSVISGAVNSLN